MIHFFIEEIYFEFSNVWKMLGAQDQGRLSYVLWIILFIFGLTLNILWIFWSIQSRPPARLIYAGLFTIGVLIQHGYWQALHRFIEPSDVGLVGVTSPRDWIASYKLFFNWIGVLFCIPYLGLLYATRKNKITGGKHLFALVACLIGLSVISTNFNGNFILGSSYSRFIHTITLYIVKNSTPDFRAELTYISSKAPEQNIVLIIDEGIRADHLSINGYQRETTPWLVELDKSDMLHNWGTASSGATCSQISNHLLLTGTAPSPSQRSDPELLPTVFQYAEALGYNLYYFDSQTNYLWNGLSTRDLGSIEWINTDRLGRDPNADLIAAGLIHEIVSNSSGNFILLNKRGVHFMYEDSYPSDRTIWGPLPPEQDYINNPELVKNPYDNGIRFTVDEFFKILLPDTNTFQNTKYIYTSDHAQTLFEDNMTWSHCNDSMQEASVPMLLLGRLEESPDLSYPASHSNILPTILDLMDYPPSEISYRYESSLLNAEQAARKRYFIDGASRILEFTPKVRGAP